MMPVPRAAMPRHKSGTLDVTDRYEHYMLSWRDQVKRQGLTERESYLEAAEIQRYIEYLNGTWWASNRPPYRSQYYDNKLADVRREALSQLSDVRPALDISCKVDDYKHQAEVVHKIIRGEWTRNAIDLCLVDWIDHSLFGTGYWKILAYEPGAMDITAWGIDHVIPVQLGKTGLQSSAAVLFRDYQSLAYFYQKFGREKCAGLERYSHNALADATNEQYLRPDGISEYTWSCMSPAMKRRMAMRRGPRQVSAQYNVLPVIDLEEYYVDDIAYNDTGEEVLVQHPELGLDEHNYHYLVKPGRRLWPRKRLIIFAGDRIMYDGPSPFWHGLYPFVMLQLNPTVWSPGGLSKYRDIVPHVRVLNRVGAGVDEAVMHAVNPTLIGKRGTIEDAVWDALVPGMPGQKVRLTNLGNPATDLHWSTPPNLPAYIGEFLRYNVDTIRQRSGSLDVQRLAAKKQVPSGEATEAMRDIMSSPFRLEARYVERALTEAGEQAVSNAFQFYTLDQRLRLLGKDGMTWEDFDLKARTMVPASSPKEDHWRLFPINIAQGSLHGSSKFQRKQEAYILRRQGDLSRKALYRLAEVPENVEQVEQEIKAEREGGIGPMPAKVPRGTRGQRTGSPI